MAWYNRNLLVLFAGNNLTYPKFSYKLCLNFYLLKGFTCTLFVHELCFLQWVFGFFAFVAPKASSPTRMKFVAIHICVGRALLYMAICAALTGLMEKATFLQLGPNQREFRLINFTGLAILLFGIFVDLSVTLAHYVY